MYGSGFLSLSLNLNRDVHWHLNQFKNVQSHKCSNFNKKPEDQSVFEKKKKGFS